VEAMPISLVVFMHRTFYNLQVTNSLKDVFQERNPAKPLIQLQEQEK